MSQKVQIAAVLLSDPELCVLDEPTTGLDPVNVRLVQDLLIERRRNGRTTILSTHQMNQVEALCDRVAMIHQGPADGLRRGRRGAPPPLAARSPRPRRGPLPPVPVVASVIDEGDGSWRLMLADGSCAVGRACGAGRRRRRHRAVRADARADGRHLPARRPRGAAETMMPAGTRSDGRHVRVPHRGQAHRLSHRDVRHAALRGRLRRDRRHPRLLRRAGGPRAGRLRRRRPGACCGSREIDVDASPVPDEMKHALEATGQSGAVERRLPAIELRVPSVSRPTARRAPRWPRATIKGYFVFRRTTSRRASSSLHARHRSTLGLRGAQRVRRICARAAAARASRRADERARDQPAAEDAAVQRDQTGQSPMAARPPAMSASRCRSRSRCCS